MAAAISRFMRSLNHEKDILGTFHVGGSTYRLLFGSDVDLEFDILGKAHGLEEKNIFVDIKSAHVSRYN